MRYPYTHTKWRLLWRLEICNDTCWTRLRSQHSEQMLQYRRHQHHPTCRCFCSYGTDRGLSQVKHNKFRTCWKSVYNRQVSNKFVPWKAALTCRLQILLSGRLKYVYLRSRQSIGNNMEELEWCGYTTVLICFNGIHERDRQMDGHRMTALTARQKILCTLET